MAEKKQKTEKTETKKTKEKIVEQPVEKNAEQKIEDKKETLEPAKEEKKETPKETKKETKPVLKKRYFAIANGLSLPISKKQAMFICRFIKDKPIDAAIADMNKVIALKKPVPFVGEIPHRKGKIMSGRYPITAAKQFIYLLKGLKGNALVNSMDLEKTRIVIATANWASRPARRGGVHAKRSNVFLRAQEINLPQRGTSQQSEKARSNGELIKAREVEK